MDSSFGDYDCLLMGGLVSDLAIFTGDAFGVTAMADTEPAAVNMLTHEGYDLDFIIAGQGSEISEEIGNCFPSSRDDGLDQPGNTGMFDLESLLASDVQPLAEALPAAKGTEDWADAKPSSILDFTFATWPKASCYATDPGSPDSGIASIDSPSSNASLSEGVPSPSSTVASASPEHTLPSQPPSPASLPLASAEDISYLERLWDDGAMLETPTSPQKGAQALLTTVVLDPLKTQATVPAPSKSPKPSSPKHVKSLTAREKKERKRAQNKNAATRYREKKRSEARVVYEEQTKMEDKNRELNEKVTLLAREIQYMKELLTEVYRAKGLVE